MIVECPKCKAVLADVIVHKPFIASCHCGLCGHDFGVSFVVEPDEVVPAQWQDEGAMPPTTKNGA